MATKTKAESKRATKSYKVIEDSDLQKIGEYFDHDIMNNPNPRCLQKCVLVYIPYFLCRRGRENLYYMDVNTFKVNTDPDDRRYVEQIKDEQDKNHGIDTDTPANEGRMYENSGKYSNNISI